MYTINKVKINKFYLINVFIALLRVSLILGNLAININVIIIDVIGLIVYGKKIFYLENKKYQFLINAFFIYLIFTTVINYGSFISLENFDLSNLYEKNILKSIFFLMFLVFFLVINKLIQDKKLDIKFFYILAGFLAFTVSIDILIQTIFGKNILGFPTQFGNSSSFFYEEIIAGGYLQKFVFFFLSIIIVKFFDQKRISILTIFLFFLFSIPIFFSGNRMPFVIYIFSCVIYFLIKKNYQNTFILIFFTLIFLSMNIKFPLVENINSRIKSFTNEIIIISKHAPKLFINENYTSSEINFQTGYLIHFNSGVQIWKKNKIIGNGLKSMPLNCKYEKFQICNTHPHNYFIEILMDVGIVGLVLIYSIFFLSFYDLIKNYFSNNFNKQKVFFFPFL